MEKTIVSNLIRKILRYGYAVNIDNGGDSYELPQPTTNFQTICKEIGATGHDNLILFRNGVEHGFVTLIHGNGEVYRDWETNKKGKEDGTCKRNKRLGFSEL